MFRNVGGLRTMLYILYRYMAQPLKLSYHRRDDEIEYAGQDGGYEYQSYYNGQRARGNVHLVLHELNDRVE